MTYWHAKGSAIIISASDPFDIRCQQISDVDKFNEERPQRDTFIQLHLLSSAIFSINIQYIAQIFFEIARIPKSGSECSVSSQEVVGKVIRPPALMSLSEWVPQILATLSSWQLVEATAADSSSGMTMLAHHCCKAACINVTSCCSL